MHAPTPTYRASEVAVIGPEDSVADILALGDGFPGLRLVPYPYELEQEAADRLGAIAPSTRVVLFTGPVPYYLATAQGEPAVPSLYVPFTGVALYRTLFQLHRAHDVSRISIDTISRESVRETYAELATPAGGVFTMEYAHALDRGELVRFHQDLYQAGETVAALTCLRSAHRALLEAGVPCFRVIPTRRDLLDVLERTHLVAEKLRTGENQIVVGLIDVADFVRERRAVGRYTEVQRVHLSIEASLVQFAQEIDGHLTPVGGDEYMFHTTQGPFLRASANLRSMPLLDHLKAVGPGAIHMGVGLGITAAQAGVHARAALEHSRRHASDSCYVVTEERRVIGPLGSAFTTQYETRTVDPRHLELARAAGVSPAAMHRLVTAIRTVGLQQFTADDVAPWLRITVRSTRRLLRRLTEVGVVRGVGEESTAVRGRPRQVFTLDDGVT